MYEISLLFFVFTTSFITYKLDDNDLKLLNIKGEVLKIEETSYEGDYKFGDPFQAKTSIKNHSVVTFNKLGNKTCYQIFSKEGETLEDRYYHYNKDEICTDIITYHAGKIKERILNTIIDDKIIGYSVVDEKGTCLRKHSFSYVNSKIIGGSNFNCEDSLLNVYQYEFSDSFEKLIIKDSQKKTTMSISSTKNEKGDNIVEVKHYPQDSTMEFIFYEYSYDEQGNWIRKSQVDPSGNVISHVQRNIIYSTEIGINNSINNLLGKWYLYDEKWIEFKQNNQYFLGRKQEVKETGLYTLQNEGKIISFNPVEGKKSAFGANSYNLQLGNDFLELYNQSRSRVLHFKKQSFD